MIKVSQKKDLLSEEACLNNTTNRGYYVEKLDQAFNEVFGLEELNLEAQVAQSFFNRLREVSLEIMSCNPKKMDLDLAFVSSEGLISSKALTIYKTYE